MLETWPIGAMTLAVSLIAPLFLRPVLRRLSVVDVPNERSSHTQTVLRGGGLGPLIAFTLGLLAVFVLFARSDLDLATIGFVALAAGVLGWVEDLRGLRVVVRAGLQLLLGIVAVLALSAHADVAWWGAAVAAFGIAGYINVANFMDGVNGMSGLHGIVVGTAFAILGMLIGEVWLVAIGTVLAASFAGFLPWNLRGRLFLGDVGSYLLGGAISVTAVAAVFSGLPLLAVSGPVVIYLTDTGFTLACRVLRGERWSEAHRTHVYQRLTDSGLSHIVVSIVVAVFGIATFAAGLLSLDGEPAGILTVFVLWGVISTVYLCTPGAIGALMRKRRAVR